jgi:hypothetical protein
MTDENAPQADEDEQPTGEGDANVGPPEDIEDDPAYEPDDEGLKDLKGG